MGDSSHVEGAGTIFRIPVDPEPIRLRLALVSVLVIGFIAGYMIINAVFFIGTCNLLAVFGGLVVGAGSMHISERYLKPRWKTNKVIEVSYTAIALLNKDQHTSMIEPTQEVETNMWYFEVPRRTRVPKGWYVVGFALEQDELYLPVYTLMPPERFAKMPLSSKFVKLAGGKGREENLRLAGQNRRLLRAESARNLYGVEMTNDDFSAYMSGLQMYFPEWMPQN